MERQRNEQARKELDATERAGFARSPSELASDIRRWWRTEPHGLWLFAGIVALGVVGAFIYQARQGYDMWPMVAYVLFFVVAASLLQLLRVAAYGFLVLLRRIGLYQPLAEAMHALDSAIVGLFKIAAWVVGIGVVLLIAGWLLASIGEGIRSLSTPGAILSGAIIIAYAIYATRSRGQ